MGAFACVLGLNAITGCQILSEVFAKQTDGNVIVENFLDDQEEEETPKSYNDRMPQILKENELSEKVFNKGWKFNLFNVQGQTSKVLAAISVIFAQLYFSLVGIVVSETPAFAITVFAYAAICMFSFLNVSYVRDFDVV